MNDRVARIVGLIQAVADEHMVFESRGQGAGNLVTNRAVAQINSLVSAELGDHVVQRCLCAGNKQSVDFFLEEEMTIIELEFSLSNPYPCIEKDLLKALLAKDADVLVRQLVLVGDPGSIARLGAPAPRAIMAWAARAHGLDVRVIELRPTARRADAQRERVDQ